MRIEVNKKAFFVAVIFLMSVIAVITLALGNSDRIAILLAPKKQAAQSRSESAIKADEVFWKTFRDGEYENIPRALEGLTAAYLETPTDAVTAAHIGWLHNWRLAERVRMESVPASITDDTMLARRYFQEAAKLDPSDARVLGFLAGHTLAEGDLHKDEKLTREGYFMMLDAIKAWPEFNLFTGGYVMRRLPADSKQFQKAWSGNGEHWTNVLEKRSIE